jgi:hypothetical protein
MYNSENVLFNERLLANVKRETGPSLAAFTQAGGLLCPLRDLVIAGSDYNPGTPLYHLEEKNER